MLRIKEFVGCGGLGRDLHLGWACFVGFAGVYDGASCLLLLLASVAILLVVY